jgi:hypothetical protein
VLRRWSSRVGGGGARDSEAVEHGCANISDGAFLGSEAAIWSKDGLMIELGQRLKMVSAGEERLPRTLESATWGTRRERQGIGTSSRLSGSSGLGRSRSSLCFSLRRQASTPPAATYLNPTAARPQLRRPPHISIRPAADPPPGTARPPRPRVSWSSAAAGQTGRARAPPTPCHPVQCDAERRRSGATARCHEQDE